MHSLTLLQLFSALHWLWGVYQDKENKIRTEQFACDLKFFIKLWKRLMKEQLKLQLLNFSKKRRRNNKKTKTSERVGQ